MNTPKVLWISALRGTVEEVPGPSASWITEFREPESGLEALRYNHTYDAVVLDFPIPEWDPADLLEDVRRQSPGTPVLVRDPEATRSDAVRLAHLGAYQFLEPGTEVAPQIEQAILSRTGQGQPRGGNSQSREDWEKLLVGESREMRQLHHLIRLVGSRKATVLITGETGTGKELAARALHLASRRTGPMVAANCGAFPEHLLEAELFGHVRGAFTGAIQSRAGRFEQAQGGTLFLDEIGDMPMDLQVKLLRVLQEREVQRLGSSETIKLDVRIVAATHCNLLERIEQGRFREDLYYRLNVVPLHMPSLRDRQGDIPVLAGHLVAKICRAEGIPVKAFTAEAMDRLSEYSWPGNVRQLENAIETAAAMSGENVMLAPADFSLPLPSRTRNLTAASAVPAVCVPDDGLDYEQTLAVIEKSILDQALVKTGGNKKAAADMLRLKRTTLSAKMRSLATAACA